MLFRAGSILRAKGQWSETLRAERRARMETGMRDAVLASLARERLFPHHASAASSLLRHSAHAFLLHDHTSADRFVSTVINEIEASSRLDAVGLDVEASLPGKPDILQIAFTPDIVAVFQLHEVCGRIPTGRSPNETTPPSCPPALASFLQSPDVRKVGVGIHRDCKSLERYFNLKIPNLIDCADMAIDKGIFARSLNALYHVCVDDTTYFKSLQTSRDGTGFRWAQPGDPPSSAVEYAANDAIASLLVYRALQDPSVEDVEEAQRRWWKFKAVKDRVDKKNVPPRPLVVMRDATDSEYDDGLNGASNRWNSIFQSQDSALDARDTSVSEPVRTFKLPSSPARPSTLPSTTELRKTSPPKAASNSSLRSQLIQKWTEAHPDMPVQSFSPIPISPTLADTVLACTMPLGLILVSAQGRMNLFEFVRAVRHNWRANSFRMCEEDARLWQPLSLPRDRIAVALDVLVSLVQRGRIVDLDFEGAGVVMGRLVEPDNASRTGAPVSPSASQLRIQRGAKALDGSVLRERLRELWNREVPGSDLPRWRFSNVSVSAADTCLAALLRSGHFRVDAGGRLNLVQFVDTVCRRWGFIGYHLPRDDAEAWRVMRYHSATAIDILVCLAERGCIVDLAFEGTGTARLASSLLPASVDTASTPTHGFILPSFPPGSPTRPTHTLRERLVRLWSEAYPHSPMLEASSFPVSISLADACLAAALASGANVHFLRAGGRVNLLDLVHMITIAWHDVPRFTDVTKRWMGMRDVRLKRRVALDVVGVLVTQRRIMDVDLFGSEGPVGVLVLKSK
ncbi:hypothetical protein BC830DRAFT_1164155 [Chytriomyces sp. MP71]|nr:hypothetical protein BC830DRAFT_1164155 [Chytriomyces sp. MP71]